MCAQKLYDALRPLRADRIGTSVLKGGLPVLRFCVLVPAEQASASGLAAHPGPGYLVGAVPPGRLKDAQIPHTPKGT